MEIRDVLVVLASVAFVLVVLWRNRPDFGSSERDRPMPKKLVGQLEQAHSAADKAALLFAAGEQALAALRYGRAESYFRRALRLQPESIELIQNVSKSLLRRPRGLESLLWRQLADAKLETAEQKRVAGVVVRELVELYQRTAKQRHKAAALRLWLRELDPAAAAASEPAADA